MVKGSRSKELSGKTLRRLATIDQRGSLEEIRFNDIPLLSGMDRINLAKLIPNFEQLEIESGEILFRQGEPADSLFIIIDGIVRVFLEPGGLSREIACLGPGECFGEMALLTGEPRCADIQAMTDLVALKLPKDRFNDLIHKHPSLGVNFAGLLANRLSFTDAVVSGRKTLSVPENQQLAHPTDEESVPCRKKGNLAPGPRISEG